METTNFHSLYGEAIEKNFLHPIRVYALVEYGGIETSFMDNIGIDKKTTATVHFHKKRLTEDQNLFVREGDFIRYGEIFYEIVKLNEPKQLFGQIDSRFEITAECIRSRDGLFNAQ
jgi:predicted rRNA methylase YqxC with S4 and FtsJ domains